MEERQILDFEKPIVELQKKISSDSGAEEKFWKLIEQIRREELSHDQD